MCIVSSNLYLFAIRFHVYIYIYIGKKVIQNVIFVNLENNF